MLGSGGGACTHKTFATMSRDTQNLPENAKPDNTTPTPCQNHLYKNSHQAYAGLVYDALNNGSSSLPIKAISYGVSHRKHPKDQVAHNGSLLEVSFFANLPLRSDY